MTGLLRGIGTLPILMYHAVPATPAQCCTPLDVPRQEFARHLDLLAQDGWTVRGLSESVATRTGRGERVLALTIDDAYADVAGAVEELRSRDMGCTVYVPTAFPDDGDARTSDVFAHPLMSWAGLQAIAAAGVELGSHARSHRPLDTLPSEQVRAELVESRERLEQRARVVVRSLCYPYGYTSNRVQRIAAEAGYQNACTVGRRLAVAGDPLLALPRLQPLPGMSDADIRTLVEHGERGLAPTAKRLLQPAWRGVRFAAGRVGVNLT